MPEVGLKRPRSGSADDIALEDSMRPATKKPTGFDPHTQTFARDVVDYSVKHRGYAQDVKDDDFPFLKPGLTVITGPTGKGKSNTVMNLLDETIARANPKRLGKVMYYTGSPQDPLLKMLDSDTVDIYTPERTQALIDRFRSLQRENRFVAEADKKLNLLVLDDAGANETLLPSNFKGSEVGDFYIGHRHNAMHIFLPVQRWKMAPPFFRDNIANLFLFNGHSDPEQNEIFRSFALPAPQLKNIMRTISGDPHKFMWINKHANVASVGFDEVMIRPAEREEASPASSSPEKKGGKGA